MKDHLGNVRVVFGRNCLSCGGQNNIYVENYADYYPYGWVLPYRNGSAGTPYRYGFQGEFAEKDAETGWNAFELRMYESRVGRWMTIDPAGQYFTPYMSMGNNPVNAIDPDGGFDTKIGAWWYSLWHRGGEIKYAKDRKEWYVGYEKPNTLEGGILTVSYQRTFEGRSINNGGFTKFNFFPAPTSLAWEGTKSWMKEHFEISGGYEFSVGFQLGGGMKKAIAGKVDLYSHVISELNLSNKKDRIVAGRYEPGEKTKNGIGGAYYGGVDVKYMTHKGLREKEVNLGIAGLGATLTYDEHGNMTDWFYGFDPSFYAGFGFGIEANFRIGFSK